MTVTWDRIWINARLATMVPDGDDRFAIVDDGAIAAQRGRIAWLGPHAALPGGAAPLAREVIDLEGRCLLPGLVDCHTHAVFAGNRSAEFAARLSGRSYEEIAAGGGGIRSTVAATRAASRDELVRAALPRLEALRRTGVTTVEIKSGYGLDAETETRMLEAAGAAARAAGLRVHRTFLGLHALPEACADRRHAYVEEVCETILPAIAERRLADSVDAFCERIAFTADEVATLFRAAEAFELPVRLHADQLSDTGGAALAARFGALSADHLEYASESGVAAMAAAGTVAVLLPGAYYSLNERRTPPVDAFRRHAVPMAVATDLNPGSSPLCSAPLAMNMACTLFRLSPAEAVAGMTVNAARALGLDADVGTLEIGKAADFSVWDVEHPAEICYWIGGPGPQHVVVAGEPVERM